ncbi:hypothetical protein D5R55_05155 [Burkholderia cenocepacia]|uniref:Uncharacterized protein n=1 Tax=Burkholderia cenocepacia TaxID=95486 RepID=A0A3Q9F1G0_9BURK|nr:hypothetical protein D5R55_05155 [Burkholderia cenocepacia]
MLGKRRRSLDIIVIYHWCPAHARRGSGARRARPPDLQQYRQDVAGLPRDRALKHNESSSIPTRERRIRLSS